MAKSLTSFFMPFFVLVLALIAGTMGQNIQRRSEILDEKGNYRVDWEINYDTEVVVFELTVATTGFIGFGLSPGGGMTGADIVIGGVLPSGDHYFNDYHGTGTTAPTIDDEQNWQILNAYETETETYLKFSREFNTCDDDDVPLTNDTINFIWAFGDTDDIGYHTPNPDRRGTFQVIPLDPELPPLDKSKFQVYEITHSMVMPSADTTYWCTIQKSPRFDAKHHIVAFEPKIETPEARAHTHHYAIFRCTPPEGTTAEDFFEPYVGGEGGDCKVPNPNIPAAYCQTMFYTWAVGGKDLIFPDDIGCPVGESDNPVDYYMFEVHYNNPEELSGVEFETGARIFYTDELREHEAGILMVAHQTSLSLMVPPQSSGYKTVGHCDPYCTSNYLPEDGINIFALLHHGHLSARKMKLRHFRGQEELEWVRNDENYDFEYQQTRPMRNEVKVLPGDHLTTECVYKTSERDWTTIGGLATSDEMCQSTFWYYPRGQLRECRSEYPMVQLLEKFGIQEIANRSFPYENVEVLAPEEFKGMPYTQVLDNEVHWSEEFRQEIQRDTVESPHEGVCYIIGGDDKVPQLTTFPVVQNNYVPINECSEISEPTTLGTTTTDNAISTTTTSSVPISTTTSSVPISTTSSVPISTTTSSVPISTTSSVPISTTTTSSVPISTTTTSSVPTSTTTTSGPTSSTTDGSGSGSFYVLSITGKVLIFISISKAVLAL